MRPLRIALLSYRSKPHSGGQGIYVRHLSRALTELGHEVTVFSGQPYPELDEGVRLEKVPSLDLYREPDPFRTPKLGEYRDAIDVLEVATMMTAGFPEPMTFSLRAARLLRDRLDEFDVVHDNQTLGWGLLDLQRRIPLVTTIHHPITVDKRVDLAAATTWRRRLSLRRWYGFLRMQGLVARRLRHIVTVSQSSAFDISRDFGVDPVDIEVIPLGVQPEVFAEPDRPRVPGRIVAMASADTPLKGINTLLEAIAKLRTERHLELVLVCRPVTGGVTERLIARLGLEDTVQFVHGLSVEELAATMGSAEVACVPSLYEGFSLPTVEAMSCGTPLVVSDAGAIPEVVGEPGVCADIVPAGDTDALVAALRSLLDDPERRARMGEAGRHRAQTGFSWEVVARATAAVYERAIREATGEND
jgi:glycosyltransferase involved in cell wall biosynthesis